VRAAQAVITRPGNREEVTLRLAVEPTARHASLAQAVAQEFQNLSRLKPDHIELLAADALAAETVLVVDRKNGA
jgi:phenylacetate-CoA ligase